MSFSIFLLLGSNLEREANIPEALILLSKQVRLKAISTVYDSAPTHDVEGPRFYNVAVAGESPLDPLTLKQIVIRPIEASLGRMRTSDKNAPRPIDIDLIHVVGLNVVGEIMLPDPDITKFAHVALPFSELLPEFRSQPSDEELSIVASRFKQGATIFADRCFSKKIWDLNLCSAALQS